MTKKKQAKKKTVAKQVVDPIRMTPDEQVRHEAIVSQRKRTFKFKQNEEGSLDYSFEDDMSKKHENLLVCETLGAKTTTSAHAIATRLGGFAIRRGFDIDKVNQAIAMVADLEPRDNVEAMLASQMFAIHEMMMECSTRAHLKEQTFEGTQLNLNSAIKLSRSFVALTDALNKHRGKGQQKMTVEHVTVNEGGQALVGSVDALDRPQVFGPRGGNKNNGQ